MSRLFALPIACLLGMVSAWSQKGLEINQLFDGRYKKDSQAVEVTISGESLSKHRLNLYRSITIDQRTDDTATIERLLAKDAALATDSETSFAQGCLHYAFYCLPKARSLNRYILYLNQHLVGGDKLILIYLEGSATPDQVKKMMKKQ